MTPTHHLIKNALMPICIDATERMRVKYKDVIKEIAGELPEGVDLSKLSDEQTKRIVKLRKYNKNAQAKYVGLGWTIQQATVMVNTPLTIAAFASDKPELLHARLPEQPILSSNEKTYPLELFTVVTFNESIKAFSTMMYDQLVAPYLNPCVTIHGSKFKILNPQGGVWDFTGNFECYSLATEEEIEVMLENLNPAQLRFIMSNDLFGPVTQNIYEENTELVSEESNDKKGKQSNE